MRLITKSLLLIAIPSLVELGLLAGLARTQAEAEASERWSLQSKAVLGQASAVLEPVLADAVRLRGAVIDRDSHAITPPGLWADIDRRIDRLTELLADNPSQVERAVQLRDSAQQFRQWSEQAREMLRNRRDAEVITLFRDASATDVIDRLRAQVLTLQREETRLDAVRSERIAAALRAQRVFFVAAVVASIAISAIAVSIFAASVRRRFERLAYNAGQLVRNVPLATLDPVEHNGDELTQLDVALHHTSRRLLEAERKKARCLDDLARRADELAATNDPLRQQTQENETFIYGVLRDLRAPRSRCGAFRAI
jgi:CHASE3 domain sensor protein